MLASLLPFLSSALTPADKSPPPDTDITDEPKVEQPKDMLDTVDEMGVKKRKERTNESFIVVRPPPSKTNHPLNLQVQLVPPSAKDPIRPMDNTSTSDLGNSLSRTSSNRSDTSMYSSYSSGSVSTVASSSSSASGRRMIIPLYNLQAHNVMQNVIVDAGTDAKVAKFLKRGLEVIGLAVLEPVEVWGAAAAEAWAVRPPYDRSSVDYSGAGLLPPDSAHTPTSSALSLTSEDAHPPPVAAPAAPERPGPKRLFGRLFKKKEVPYHLPRPPPSPVTSIAAATVPLSKRSSLHLQSGSMSLTAGEPSVILQPAVLGIQPVLSSVIVPPRGRPTQYVWVVRRWLKGSQESLLGGVKDMLQQDARTGNGVESVVEVRFEWTRGRSGKARRGRRRGGDDGELSRERGERTERSGVLSKRNSIGRSSTPSTASLQHQPPARVSPPSSHMPLAPPPPSHTQSPVRTQSPRMMRPAASPTAPRRSLDSHRSASPRRPASIGTNETSAEDEARIDIGNESDPEDSETPWTCTLVVRRLAPMRSAELGIASPQPPPLKLKVAAVIPTPHHPKVVALLKVPFPLPDIEVEHVRMRKRIVTPAGVARPAPVPEPPANGNGKAGGPGKGFWTQQPQREGLMLTAEEIKDVVSSTSLWLVVREAFGGVGRVNRKGDGWRLRR